MVSRTMMEKETLLEMVIQEIKEVEKLMVAFRGKPSLPPAFVKLARNKVNNILEEIALLEEISAHSASPASASRASTLMHSHEAETFPEQMPTETTGSHSSGQKSGAKEGPTSIPLPGRDEDEKQAERSVNVTLTDNPERPAEPESKREESTSSGERAEEASYKLPEQEAKKEEAPPQGTAKDAQVPTNGNSKTSGKGVLGETLGREKSSYNEMIAQKSGDHSARHLISSPVNDLRKALGINDRFFYQRELFDGSADLLNQTIDQINQMQSFEDARNFLRTNFNWNTDNEAASDFMALIGRRFS